MVEIPHEDFDGRTVSESHVEPALGEVQNRQRNLADRSVFGDKDHALIFFTKVQADDGTEESDSEVE